MIKKKTIIGMFLLCFLNGCVQSTALLGPAITIGTTGNVVQAGLQLGTNHAIKQETGKDALTHITDAVDKDKKKKIFNKKLIKLLNVQKDATIKQLIKYPDLYYAKSSFPLEISQRAFDFLWRMCESYELWCKETGQSEKLLLKITD